MDLDALRAAIAEISAVEPDRPVPPRGDDPAVAAAEKAAMRLVTVRARSRHELRGRLADKDYPLAVVDLVIARLEALRILDDAAFAEQWVRARHAGGGRGRAVLARELREKGVCEHTADAALAQINDEDERAAARRIVGRRLETVSPGALDDPAERRRWVRRLGGMLARRGLVPADALGIATRAIADHRAGVA